MSNNYKHFYVDSHRRNAGQCIVESSTLGAYCHYEGIRSPTMIADILESHDRFEYYIKDSLTDRTIGSFFLTIMEDMHHGKMAILAAHWVALPYRNDIKIHREVMFYVKRFCDTFGVTKYQRTVNLSSYRQLLITKEV